ncbi:unnamed protein product, partial [Closterium sp. NIES-54]
MDDYGSSSNHDNASTTNATSIQHISRSNNAGSASRLVILQSPPLVSPPSEGDSPSISAVKDLLPDGDDGQDSEFRRAGRIQHIVNSDGFNWLKYGEKRVSASRPIV